MAAQTEVMIKNENKPEAEEALKVFIEMTEDERKRLSLFMQGAMYAKEIYMAKAQRGDSDGRG